MRAAVDDVHHRHGQRVRPGAAQVAVERRLLRGCRRARGGHRNRQDGVGAQAALVGCAVEVDHGAVDRRLRGGVLAYYGLGDFAVDVAGGLQRAFAEVARLIAVPQFHCFVLAGGRAGRHRGPPHAAVSEMNIRFHRRIPAGIENLSSNYFYDRRQLMLLV